jgi:hypothetical protein
MICSICKFLLLLQKFLCIRLLILIDLYAYSNEGFIEPPSKKAKMSPRRPTPATSEASDRAAATDAQPSTASSLSKGKEIPSTAVVVVSPSPTKKRMLYDDQSAYSGIFAMVLSSRLISCVSFFISLLEKPVL